MFAEETNARAALYPAELWFEGNLLADVSVPFIPPIGCEVILTASDRPYGGDFYRVIDVSFEFHLGRIEAPPPTVRVVVRRAAPKEQVGGEPRIRVTSRSCR